MIVGGLLDGDSAASAEDIERLFKENITPKVIDLKTGAITDVDANTFDWTKHRPIDKRRCADRNEAGAKRLPHHALIYEKNKNGKLDRLILPVSGKGLWVFYGFFALGADTNTVKGIIFYKHQDTWFGWREENPNWMSLWPGKLAFAVDGAGTLGQPKIEVKKGPAQAGDKYGIDGLSGATITSRGVTGMLKFWLGDSGFGPYLAQVRKGG